MARHDFETNLEGKLAEGTFVEDLAPLLAEPGSYDAARAARLVLERLISRLSAGPRPSSDATT